MRDILLDIYPSTTSSEQSLLCLPALAELENVGKPGDNLKFVKLGFGGGERGGGVNWQDMYSKQKHT